MKLLFEHFFWFASFKYNILLSNIKKNLLTIFSKCLTKIIIEMKKIFIVKFYNLIIDNECISNDGRNIET